MKRSSPIKKEQLLFKSGYPVNTYILIGLPVVILLLCLLNKANLLGLVFYLPAFLLLFYYFFCRYSCKIELLENRLKIRYFVPWNKNRTIDLKGLEYVDYGRGHYAPFSDRPVAYRPGLRICYDLLRLSESMEVPMTEVRINTRMFGFKSLVNTLRKTCKMCLVKVEEHTVIGL
ncbi:hypothetical protein [Pedobacter caeni]|uniref:PH domain-containing protein n=1 Tax=Pedobacter caeni TaxID=288992 RepID=A0A1M5JLU4_9SPHI|nr:hypothetical protein [Pedobacter caeni]SHG41003.1 hypothetical protein SAMN04488522_105397 [Pedobacter caeni]